MHKTKKLNTGMHEYLRDLFRSLKNKEVMGKLRKSGNYLDSHKLCIENEEFNLISTEHNRLPKKLKIYFSEYNTKTNEFESLEHMMIIHKNGEIHFQEAEYSATYLLIDSKEALFNLAIQYEIYYSYEDLHFLKRLFKRLVKKRNVSEVSLYYAKGEEKLYGY